MTVSWLDSDDDECAHGAPARHPIPPAARADLVLFPLEPYLAPAPSEPPGPPGPRLPANTWPWWTAPAALFGGLLLAAVGGLVVDIPAALFGVSITSSSIPGWLEILDTVVQDAAFVLVAVLLAKVGGRTVRAWQFGLQRPGIGWLSPRSAGCGRSA